MSATLKALFRGIFPPPETLRRIYGLEPQDKLQYLYYVIRPLDLLLRQGGRVLGLVVGRPRSRPALEKERRRRLIQAWARGKTPKA